MNRSVRSSAAALLAVAALAACSSSKTSGDAPKPPTSSTTAPDANAQALAYTKRGPNPVGVVTRRLPTGNSVEIWYPAAAGTTGTSSYDLRDFIPPAVRKLLTTSVGATVTVDAARDAAPATGRYPIVLFSHGFSGMRDQSTFLTTHLASWGMIVAAPDHPSRDLNSVLSGKIGNQHDAVQDLQATLDLVERDSMLGARADATRVAAVGHSAGGGTALQAANEIPAVQGYVSLASGALTGRSGPSTSAGATSSTGPGTTVAMPAKPSLFVAGAADGVVPLATVTRPAFERAPTPPRLWVIARSGHNAFDDFCTVGNGKGIIGLAEASGLGPLLAAQPQLKKLGEDGCVPPAAPVRDAWPAIDHVVTAWLRNLFGIDARPVGLDQVAPNTYALPVTVESRG